MSCDIVAPGLETKPLRCFNAKICPVCVDNAINGAEMYVQSHSMIH